METEDVADAVADIRRYWGSDNEYTDEEIFILARCKWEGSRGSVDAAKEFVLQVVASQLEEQLLTWLLQLQAADAAENIQILVSACMHPYFTSKGLELLTPVLDALLTLTLTLLRATGCDQDFASRKRRMAKIVGKMEDGVFKKSKAWCVLRKLDKSEMKDDAEAWTTFLELSNVLDPRAFNSRSGRVLMNEAEQVISVQQVELAAVRGSISDVRLDEEEVAAGLWDIAEQIVEFIEIKTEPIAGSQDTNGPSFAFDVALVMNLEGYLKVEARDAPPGVNDILDHETQMIDEDIELSAAEQLSSICFSSEEELVVSSDILEKVFIELSAIKRIDTMSIQVSFLLGMQMRLKCCFIDHCESAKIAEFGRRLKRVLNQLAGKDQDMDHAASLVILSAFCPRQVIHECIRGAQTGVLHHALCFKVLRASPLLLEWHDPIEDGSGSLFELELQQTVLDISRDQSSFDRESPNVLSFLLSLVGIDGSTSSKRGASLMTVSKLIDALINPVWCCPNQSVEMQLNLLTMIQQLFQRFVAVTAGVEIESATIQMSFNLAFGALDSANANDPKVGALIRERLLLLLKNTMELMPDPASTIRLEQLNIPLTSSVWTLICLFNGELGNEQLCKGLEDVAAVEAYMQTGEAVALPLPNVISAIQALLWGLLWDSVLSENVSVESTKSETWRLLDTIANFEFCEAESIDETIKGSLLIESAVAEMMLECGSVLFRVLLCNIVPFLLKYEPAENSQEEKLTIPQWAIGKLTENPEIIEHIPCQLVSTHWVMRYVAKCWGLSGAANIQQDTQSNLLVLESLNHAVAAHDQAITASSGSLSRTLFCIQWLCFLVSAARELHFDTLSAWPAIRTQLELSFLRLLHQLELLKGILAGEAKFSQYFVAAWLGYLPADQFEQVFNFISTKRNN